MNRLLCLLLFCLGFSFVLVAEDLPIDVVYTWVNDQDSAWQQARELWYRREYPEAPLASGAGDTKRFRNREELRYSLRSIYTYMPYVNHIYIVTCGQRPSWLKDHPKISFIDQKEIFKNSTDLPTFNSMAIETNLHRISNLSERYVYFNDDVFLTEMTVPANFFTLDGKIRLFFSKHEMETGEVSSKDNGFFAASKNTANLLQDFYGKKKRYTHAHTPFPSLRSVAFRAESMFPEVFSLVSSHHFRSRNDFTITNGLIPYVALYSGQAEESLFSSLTWMFGDKSEKDKRAFEEVRKHPPQFVCIQDSLEDASKAEKTDKRLKQYLQILFPNKAPWEE